QYRRKLIAVLFCLLLTVGISLYYTGRMDIRAVQIFVLGALSALNAAYFFARVKRGSVRRAVVFILVIGSLAFYWGDVHYAIDPRLFLLSILIGFIVLNIVTVFFTKLSGDTARGKGVGIPDNSHCTPEEKRMN